MYTSIFCKGLPGTGFFKVRRSERNEVGHSTALTAAINFNSGVGRAAPPTLACQPSPHDRARFFNLAVPVKYPLRRPPEILLFIGPVPVPSLTQPPRPSC